MSFSSNSEHEDQFGIASRNSRPKKVHVKNINTVNLGLLQNVDVPSSLDFGIAQGFSSSMSGHGSPSMKSVSSSRRRDHALTQGERIIFAESPAAPGIPIVYRLEEERRSNPDKLNLDRRKLAVCPILEGEENLRLLNLQHNIIRKIQHMTILKRLIFLDLYDNHIEEISGLSSLKCLRVLMLGKNRIRVINNLHELVLLDVLDLHGNKITKIENLSHLRQLRVLNLAGNDLSVVKNVSGLISLSELNLRRNEIRTVLELDQLPSLQRLFLSFNEIKSFDDISCLSRSTSLADLSLDGNPFHTCSDYKQSILQSIAPLKQLDMKRISEEEKRIAQVIAKKEEEKRKESERLSSIKEKRRLAINNAQRQWQKQFDSKESLLSTTNSALSQNHPSHKSNVDVKEYSSCHLAELDSNVLNLYGPRSLDAMNKNWGDQTANGVEKIIFKFINFKEVIPYFSKVHQKFPSLKTLEFERTNISTLNDINALAVLGRLENLIISEGNTVVEISFWQLYAVYRLEALSLKSINDTTITPQLKEHSQQMFGRLKQVAENNLSTYKRDHLKTIGRQYDDDGIIGLIYRTSDESSTKENEEQDTFSVNYIREIQQDSILVSRRLVYFEKLWPQMLREMVTKYSDNMNGNLNEYCKSALENIKKTIS